MNTEFAKDVDLGLSAQQKNLSSKYFYDEIGDQIFVKIMNMPEYYLTNSEYEILSEQSKDIVCSMDVDNIEFELIELGAGNGTKTIELLSEMKELDFVYKPIDISSHAISNIQKRLKSELPWLKVEGKQGEYFQVLKTLRNQKRKIILFLGSNIGNLLDKHSKKFINQLSAVLNKGDKLILGVDRKKSKSIVLPAYNDAQGFSRDFNLNLLRRINKELHADFDLNKFQHAPEYDEGKGIAYSYLRSTCEQSVNIKKIGKVFHFKDGEKIHTEISRKYDDDVIRDITAESNFKIEKIFSDKRNYFSDYLLIN